MREHKALSKALCLILALVLVLLAGCDYILTSSDGSVLITGNETTNVVDLRVAGNVSGGAGGNHTASDIEVSRLAGSTYDDVQDYIDVYGSRGLISGGEITDNGDGTVNVAAGTAWLRISDTALASLPFVDFGAEANLALTDQQVNYIYVDYNAGTPLVLATINFATIANDTRALLAITFRDGNEIHITYLDGLGTDIASKINLHLFQRFGISRTNGLIIGSSNRYITLTPGIIWGGLKDSSSAGFDTDPGGGADTFTGWHTPDSGGSWNKELAQSEVDNLQYNDITSGLVTLTANRYVVGWVWVDFDGENLHYQYGQGDYTLNQAVAAQPPAVTPPLITGYCFLVGKVIMQKSAATMEAQSHFDLSFSGTSPSDHAALSNVTPDQHHTEDHTARHTDGSDDIQDATSGQKGLATATQITKLDGIEAGADVTDTANVDAAGAVMESDFNAKGDILSASADDTPLILTVGANGTILTADPGEASGLKWAAAAGGGDITSDPAWAAKGDLIVADGDDSAQVLSVGTDGMRPEADSGEATGVKWSWPSTLRDADGDTLAQVEEAPDEDHIRLDVAGSEAMVVHEQGIIDYPLQSSMVGYGTTGNQYIPTATATKPRLDLEDHDNQNEFNSDVIKSTATAGTGGTTLVDSTNPFVVGDVGKTVWNRADNLYTTIAGYTSTSTVTLTANIGLASGEAYEAYLSRWTATEDGTYLIIGQVGISVTDRVLVIAQLVKNGVNNAAKRAFQSYASALAIYAQTVVILQLVANDYIELIGYHNQGISRPIAHDLTTTFLSIRKVG